MSLSMRPVREEWGEATALFLDSDAVVDLLANVANNLGIAYVFNDTDQGAEVIIPEGGRLLDYFESNAFAAPTVQGLLSTKVNDDDLASLVQNLKSLADNWRSFLDGDA